MAGFTFITTGTQATIVIDELDLTFNHPETITSDTLELQGADVLGAASIQQAVDDGHLIVQDSLGNPLTSLTFSNISKSASNLPDPSVAGTVLYSDGTQWVAGRPYQIAKLKHASSKNLNANATQTNMVWDSIVRNDSSFLSQNGGQTIHTLTGTFDHVEISVNIHGTVPDAVAGARAAPYIRLIRDNDGVELAASTGYIRDSTDHEQDDWTFSVIDENPPVNPSYRLTQQRDSTNAGAVNSDIASTSVSFKAWF